MRAAILAAALVLASGDARAQMPPTYDIVGWCRDNVAAGGFPDDGEAQCVVVEQRKARLLRSRYWTVPPEVRDQCETTVASLTRGRGSYAILAYCIEESRKE